MPTCIEVSENNGNVLKFVSKGGLVVVLKEDLGVLGELYHLPELRLKHLFHIVQSPVVKPFQLNMKC